MCGISGLLDYRRESTETTLAAMSDSLTHRGPDDHGLQMVSTDDYQIGLAHRRLAILDLSASGHQPMHFEHLTVVFNGEIYNFAEVRQALETEGYTFDSRSDTEVILKAYDRWGMRSIDRFVGMFAYALLDRRAQKLYLVRDRAGVKPLFYYWDESLLLFASELKSFHHHPRFPRNLDAESLHLYMRYGYIPNPHCIFKDCQKVKPGHYLTFDLRRRTYEDTQYWSVIEAYNQPLLDVSEAEAEQHLEELLRSAFRYRMVSDVPVGVFLSGGYDSSAVAALLQAGMSRKLKTFTIGFREKGFDETAYAKQVADHLGTDHTQVYCTAQEAAAIIPSLPEIYDEPFADNSGIPTTLVSRLARQQVTVALSADGGDEIFAGYPKFQQSLRFTQTAPPLLQRALSGTMQLFDPERIPYLREQYNFATRYEKMTSIWQDSTPAHALDVISQYYTDSQIEQVFRNPPRWKKTNFNRRDELRNRDELNNLLAIDYLTFLVDNNMNKVDRATMSVSLEGREPLLDHRIVAFTARLPAHYKLRNGTGKYLLRKIVHKYVSPTIMERPKMPFIAPVVEWLRNDLKEMFLTYLSEERLRRGDLFDPQPVLKMRDDYLGGRQMSAHRLWMLLTFAMWEDRWMKAPVPTA